MQESYFTIEISGMRNISLQKYLECAISRWNTPFCMWWLGQAEPTEACRLQFQSGDIRSLHLHFCKWIFMSIYFKHHSGQCKWSSTFIASFRRHPTFDPWIVQTTAGFHKRGEERRDGCLKFLLEMGRWNRLTAQTYQNHLRCYFYYVPLTATWFNASDHSCVLYHRNMKACQSPINTQMCFRTAFSFNPLTLFYFRSGLCFCSIFSNTGFNSGNDPQAAR